MATPGRVMEMRQVGKKGSMCSLPRPLREARRPVLIYAPDSHTAAKEAVELGSGYSTVWKLLL